MGYRGGEDSVMAARQRLCRPGPQPSAGLPPDLSRRLGEAESQLDALDANASAAWAFIQGLDEEDTASSTAGGATRPTYP